MEFIEVLDGIWLEVFSDGDSKVIVSGEYFIFVFIFIEFFVIFIRNVFVGFVFFV